MRCKYCNRPLEQHQYKWDEKKGEWYETGYHYGGNCINSGVFLGADPEDTATTDSGLEDVPYYDAPSHHNSGGEDTV